MSLKLRIAFWANGITWALNLLISIDRKNNNIQAYVTNLFPF